MKHGTVNGLKNIYYRIRSDLIILVNNPKARFIAVNGVFALVTVLVGIYFKNCYGSDLSAAFTGVNIVMLLYISYYRWRGFSSGGVQLIFLLLFVVFNMTICCELISNDSVVFIDTPKFLLNFLLYASVYYIVFVLSNNAVVTVIVPGLFWGILASINYFLNDVRGRPLFLSDLFSIGTAMNVADTYAFTFTVKFIVIWLFMLFMSMFIIYMSCEFGKKNLKVRLRFRLSGLVVIAALFFIVPSDTILEMAGVEPYFWTHKKNGFPLNFIMDLKYSSMSAAEEYSADLLDTMYDDYNVNTVYDDGTVETELKSVPAFETELVGSETDTDTNTEANTSDTEQTETEIEINQSTVEETKRPNVIIIMNETFSDMRVVGDFETNTDVMPFIDSLSTMDNTITGNTYVSVFGGGTADSEYEFLMGDNMYIYSQGAIPYQLNFKNSTYISSVVSTFNTLGYRTVSLHPYLSSGWNRPSVYSAMQFDEQYYDEAFENDENVIKLREYISDESDYNKVIELYEQTEEGTPFFCFNVTMQNHGGYGTKYDNFEQEITINGHVGQYPKAEQYLSLMHESDKAIQKLIEYFENVDEPTVILFYGDHQGTVEDSFYELLWGKSASSLTAQELQSKYITKYFIWANFDLDTSWLGENEDRHSLNTSISYLSSILFNSVGLPTSAYQNFLSEQRKVFPIISSFGVIDKNGEYYSIGNKSDEIYSALRPYEMLIYNHVYDKKNTLHKFFSLLPTSAEYKKITNSQ